MFRLLVVAGALIGANWGQRPVAFAQEKEPSAAVEGEAATAAAPAAKNLELERGWEFYRRGEWGKAQAAFERAIAAEPASPLPHVGRAYALNAQHQYDQGTAELWQAIRCNPGDVGLDYDPLANRKKKLSAEALHHGEEQVRKMLKDRPAMAKHVSPQDVLWKWAVRKFAGEDVGVSGYWDSSDPTPLTSDSRRIAKDGPFAVCAAANSGTGAASRPRRFDELWSDVIFQLHSIAPGAANQTAQEDSKTEPELETLEAYNVDFLEAEEVTAQRTRAFYLRVYLPWLRRQPNVATNPANWHFYAFPPTDDKQARLDHWRADPRWKVYAVWYKLARVRREFLKNDIEKCREILSDLIDGTEKATEWQLALAHYWLGQAFIRERNLNGAIDELTKAIALRPIWPSALVNRGMLFELTKEFDRAIADLDAAIRFDPSQSNSWAARGGVWFDKHDFNRAVGDLTAAIRLNPKDLSAYESRARTRRAIGLYAEAIADLSSAIELNSKRADLYFCRATIWHLQADFDREVEDLTTGLQLDPKVSIAYYDRGQAYIELERYAEAINDYLEAARLEPDNIAVQGNLAWQLATCPEETLRDGPEAIAAATKACELSEWKHWRDISLLAYALAEAGQFDEAIKRMDEAVKLAADATTADESDKQNLRDRLELLKIGKAYHQIPTSELERGWAFYHRSKWESALGAFEKAKAAEPNSPLPYAGRAYVYFAQQKYDEGIEEMWEAIRHNPGDVGLDYDPGPKGALNAKALKHGEEQLRKMLHDRPAMAEHIKPGDELWKWAVRKFGGEDVNALVYWDPMDPNPRSAVCYREANRYFIRVSAAYQRKQSSPSRSFDELWSDAVYELQNIVCLNNVDEIYDRVMREDMTCGEYNEATFVAEHTAVQQTRAFYLKFYLPWFRSTRNGTTNPADWHCYHFPPAGDRNARLRYWRANSVWDYNSVNYDLICANREYEKGDFQKTYAILEPLVVREQDFTSSQSSSIHYLLGCLHEIEGDPKKAIEEYDKSLSSDPSNYEAALGRGRIFAHTGAMAKAIEVCTKLIKLNSDRPEAFYSRGQAYAATQQFTKAIADFDTAIRIAPENSSFFIDRGEAWHFKNNYERAIADYTTAIRLNPYDPGPYGRRALAYEKQNQFAAALSDWNDAVRLGPDAEEFRSCLAMLLTTCPDKKVRNPQAAIAPATKACELTSWSDRHLIESLAFVLAEAGKFDEAVERMEQASELLGSADEATKNQFNATLELYKSGHAMVGELRPVSEIESTKVFPCRSAAAPCDGSACCQRRCCRRGFFVNRRCRRRGW